MSLRNFAKVALSCMVAVVLTFVVCVLFFQDELLPVASYVENIARANEISYIESKISENAGQYGVSDKRGASETEERSNKSAKTNLKSIIPKEMEIPSSGDASVEELSKKFRIVLNNLADNMDKRRKEELLERISACNEATSLPEPIGEAIIDSSWKSKGTQLLTVQLSDTSLDLATSDYARRLGYIPNYHKELFNELGWKIVLTDENLNDRAVLDSSYDDAVLTGLCCYYEKTIYLKVSDSSQGVSIIHEMGHFMDYIQGRPSLDDDFLSAYEADKESYEEKFWYDHLNEDPEKYAEAYEAYYLTPTRLKEYCPNIYNYFAEHL